MINTNSVEYKRFIDNLTVKTVKGQNYYYYRINNPVLKESKQIYIGKFSKNHKPFIEYYLKKVFVESRETFNEILHRNYDNDYLTPSLAIFFDILRYSFHFSMREFSTTDIQKFEEARFTKYVHGTTSVEGNTYTLRETDITLNMGRTVKGKDNREFYEIDNYRRWKKFLNQNNEFTCDTAGIKTIHKNLMANIDDPYITPGDFRNVPAYIRGSDFQPTPHILIEDELDELVDWYEQNKENKHPIELIAQYHQRFEEIHPFNDGNGRVGREIMRLQLNEFGFPSIFISENNRDDYLFSLDSSNNGDYSSITSFIATLVIKETLSALDQYAEFMTDVLSMDEYKDLHKIINKDESVKKLLFTILNEINRDIKNQISDLLNTVEQSNQTFVETKLLRKLDRIIEDPFLELKIFNSTVTRS